MTDSIWRKIGSWIGLAAAVVLCGLIWKTVDLGHTEILWALPLGVGIALVYGLYMYSFTGLLRLAGAALLHAANHIDEQHARGQAIARGLIRAAIDGRAKTELGV